MPLLEVDDVVVQFGGVTAGDHASFVAEAGRVTGLIGPNGAGKTTMFNVITGLQTPTEGRIFIGDGAAPARKPHKRARLRMARTFQRLEVFGSLTARENILVAAEIRNGWSKDRESPQELPQAILEPIGMTSFADEPVDSMPTGLARLVELGRAL